MDERKTERAETWVKQGEEERMEVGGKTGESEVENGERRR